MVEPRPNLYMKDTPYLTLMCELWGVYCKYIEMYYSCYKGIPLYFYFIATNNSSLSIHYVCGIIPGVWLPPMFTAPSEATSHQLSAIKAAREMLTKLVNRDL